MTNEYYGLVDSKENVPLILKKIREHGRSISLFARTQTQEIYDLMLFIKHFKSLVENKDIDKKSIINLANDAKAELNTWDFYELRDSLDNIREALEEIINDIPTCETCGHKL